MVQVRDAETEFNKNSILSLPEFCDMEQLYRLIDNWSKSSGMYAVIVDNDGNRISDSFGMTEFCRTGHENTVPIVLPDGQVLGRVLVGQALSVNQKEDNRKSEIEIQSAYALLEEIMSFFIEKSYSIWKTNNELKNASVKNDRVLSQITQIMYSYNLTLNLRTGKYSMIIGNVMKQKSVN